MWLDHLNPRMALTPTYVSLSESDRLSILHYPAEPKINERLPRAGDALIAAFDVDQCRDRDLLLLLFQTRDRAKRVWSYQTTWATQSVALFLFQLFPIQRSDSQLAHQFERRLSRPINDHAHS
jgi:hypothetical protein